MRHNIQPALRHLFNLILRGGNNHGHIGCLQHIKPCAEFRHARIPARLIRRCFASTRHGTQIGQFLFSLLGFNGPMRLHLVIHSDGSGLINGNHQRLAQKATPQEMPHNILCHGVQPVITRDQVILPPQHLFQLGFLILIQARIFDQAVQILIQVRIDQFQFRGPVFIKQRDCRAIFH